MTIRYKCAECGAALNIKDELAGTRGSSLIINLPGKPRAIRECLEVLAPAIREGVAHLHGEDVHK